jgi:flagellar basal body-associated protein FliL
MRVALIVLLVLLNLGVFAYFYWQQAASHTALPELSPEKMNILTEQEAQANPQIDSSQAENQTPQ